MLLGIRLVLLVAFFLLQGLEIDPHIPGSTAVAAAEGLKGLAGEGLDAKVLIAGGSAPLALGTDQPLGDAMANPEAQAEDQPVDPVPAGGGAGGWNRDHGCRQVGVEWRGSHTARCAQPPRKFRMARSEHSPAEPGGSGGCREGLHDDGNHQRGLEPKRPCPLGT